LTTRGQRDDEDYGDLDPLAPPADDCPVRRGAWALVSGASAALGVFVALGACVGAEPTTATSPTQDATAESSGGDAQDASPPTDGGTDGRAGCELSWKFGEAREVGGLGEITEFTLDAKELVATVSTTSLAPPDASAPPVGLFRATRSSRNAPFGEKEAYATLKTVGNDRGGELSADGLTMMFFSDKTSKNRLQAANRTNVLEAFSPPQEMTVPMVGEENQAHPHWIDPQHVLLSTYDPHRVYRAVWDGEKFKASSVLAELDDFIPERASVSAGEEVIFFNTPVGGGVFHLYEAFRQGATFGMPRRIDELASSGGELAQWTSRDGCRVYFTKLETNHLFFAERIP
jgi:hypothetical protein